MASVPETLIGQIFADATITALSAKTAIGRRATEQNLAPPSIVAIPMGADTLDPPDRPGDALYSNAGRILLLRRFKIEWQCFAVPTAPGAVDFTNSEMLYAAVIRAIRNNFHNSVRFSGEEWLDQQDGQDGYERWGTTIKFFSTLDIPLYDARGGIVELTASPKISTTATEGTETVTFGEG